VKKAVMQTPNEKAPRPNGYIGVFYKSCWDIIKMDVMAALQEMFELRAGCWNLLNTANIALIAKK
jgi:retron-type reverse transcriptase